MPRFSSALLKLMAGVALCLAQSPKELVQEGFRLYDRQQYEPARQYFEQALKLAGEQGTIWAEAEARRGLGEILSVRAQYAAARAELEQALTLFQKLSDRAGAGKVYNDLGYAAQAMGNRELAREFYHKALREFEASGELSGKASILYNLAFVRSPDAEKVRLMEEALELARRSGNRRLEGKILHLWGDTAYSLGDFSSAMELLEAAWKVLEPAGFRSDLSRVMTSLGRLHRFHGHPDRALEFHRRALKILEELGDRRGVIQSLHAAGSTLSIMGQRREAVEHYERALAMARESGSSSVIQSGLAALASAHVQTGGYGRAVQLLEEALGEANARVLPSVFETLIGAYLGLGRHSEALAMAEKAVQSAQGERLVDGLYRRALVKQKMGRTDEALADVSEAVRIVEQFRARLVPSDFMKRGFADQYGRLFTLAMELHYPSGKPERSFEIAEQARARAFLDLLATREPAGGLEPIPTARIEAVPHALTLRGGETGPASFGKPSHSADPGLKSQATATAASARQAAAAAARLRSTVLAYWVSSEATFLWVVRPDGAVHSARVPVSADRLRQLILETSLGPHPAWAPPGRGEGLVFDDAQLKAWRQLYQVLIQPVRRLLPNSPGARLTIIPHGPLFELSFAALPDDQGRYLVENCTLHYVPAAAMLEFTGRTKQQNPLQPPRYLVVADPSSPPLLPGGRRLPPLPGARREAAAIARLLPAGAVTLLAGEQAREENLRAALPGKRVIHFATHAIVSDGQPFDSFLALSHQDRLTARQIYELQLDADLVVLSACRTGRGKISGDGTAGLSRAFFYAGTPSVLATLWDVPDQPTYLLVSEFYRAWRRLGDKSRALRAAQLHLLKALRGGEVKIDTPAGAFAAPVHPVFWAGFVLLGQPN